MFPATVQLLDEAILHALVDESVDVFCDSIDEARSAFQNNIISEGVLAIFMTFPFFWATLDSPGVKLTCFDPVTYAEPETWFVDFYNEAIKNLKIKPDLLRDGGVQVWYDDDKQLELFDVRKNLQHRQDLVKRTWEYGRNRMIAKAAAVARKEAKRRLRSSSYSHNSAHSSRQLLPQQQDPSNPLLQRAPHSANFKAYHNGKKNKAKDRQSPPRRRNTKLADIEEGADMLEETFEESKVLHGEDANSLKPVASPVRGCGDDDLLSGERTGVHDEAVENGEFVQNEVPESNEQVVEKISALQNENAETHNDKVDKSELLQPKDPDRQHKTVSQAKVLRDKAPNGQTAAASPAKGSVSDTASAEEDGGA